MLELPVLVELAAHQIHAPMGVGAVGLEFVGVYQACGDQHIHALPVAPAEDFPRLAHAAPALDLGALGGEEETIPAEAARRYREIQWQ